MCVARNNASVTAVYGESVFMLRPPLPRLSLSCGGVITLAVMRSEELCVATSCASPARVAFWGCLTSQQSSYGPVPTRVTQLALAYCGQAMCRTPRLPGSKSMPLAMRAMAGGESGVTGDQG